MDKTKNPVKFPLTQPVRDEYAEFYFGILWSKFLSFCEALKSLYMRDRYGLSRGH